MILSIGDTQVVPGVGIFEWDGVESWVCDDIVYTHGQLYTILLNMGLVFEVDKANGF